MTDQNKNAIQTIQNTFRIHVIPAQISMFGMESLTDLNTTITILRSAKNKNKELFNNRKNLTFKLMTI